MPDADRVFRRLEPMTPQSLPQKALVEHSHRCQDATAILRGSDDLRVRLDDAYDELAATYAGDVPAEIEQRMRRTVTQLHEAHQATGSFSSCVEERSSTTECGDEWGERDELVLELPTLFLRWEPYV
jgi:hypothetical protein